MEERELGDGAADAALDPLRAVGDLVLAFALAPLLGAVGVPDGHADDRDREVGAGDRDDARDPAAGADDHVPADLLPEDPVRAPDVVLALRRDGGRLEAETGLADRGRGLVDDRVLSRPARLEREVVAGELERDPDRLGSKDAERLLEQLLSGLVPFEDDDRRGLHGGESRWWRVAL